MAKYLGETKAKAVTRSVFWKDVVTELKRSGVWKTKPIMVLASAVGGDIPVLQRAGLSHDMIVAVDCDAKALRAFSRKYPKIKTHCGRVLDILKGEASQSYAAVYLDFCGQLCLPTVLAMMEARRVVDKRGVFACNLSLKRERSLTKDWTDVWDKYATEWTPKRKLDASIARVSHPALNAGSLSAHIKSFNSLNLPCRTTRIHTLQALLSMFGMQHKPSKLHGMYEYKSNKYTRMCAFTMQPAPRQRNQALVIPPKYKEFVLNG